MEKLSIVSQAEVTREDKIVIGSVGRLSEQKNIPFLLVLLNEISLKIVFLRNVSEIFSPKSSK